MWWKRLQVVGSKDTSSSSEFNEGLSENNQSACQQTPAGTSEFNQPFNYLILGIISTDLSTI